MADGAAPNRSETVRRRPRIELSDVVGADLDVVAGPWSVAGVAARNSAAVGPVQTCVTGIQRSLDVDRVAAAVLASPLQVGGILIAELVDTHH